MPKFMSAETESLSYFFVRHFVATSLINVPLFNTEENKIIAFTQNYCIADSGLSAISENIF